MSNPRYRATINGFWCHNETWDDVFNWDGKHDEVFLSVNTKVTDVDGKVLDNLNSESELMGDTWRLSGRVQAGSASDRGGIVSGDKFPWDQPMRRQNGLNTTSRVPPYAIWEGELPSGRMVLLTPTIWEWDPGAGAWDGWLAWQQQTDEKYGQRAKEIFGKIWPVSMPVFDAVSLGIQTVATLDGLWSPLGQSMRRPIGLQRDPANPDGSLFNPYTIALSADTAEYLAESDPQGHGVGIRELTYTDDPYLRGVYSIFVQVEKLSDGTPSEWADAGHANGVAAMTALDGRLYCATVDNALWMRDAVRHEVDWQRIGHANDVVGMAASGGRLFCATRDNRLWTREAVPYEVDWTPVGRADDVVGMTAQDGRLFCATADDSLYVRPAVAADANWAPAGRAEGVLALAADSADLYRATATGLSRRGAAATDAAWQPIGTAPGIRGLAASYGALFAATADNRLLVRDLP
jgi:hypothetical protein